MRPDCRRARNGGNQEHYSTDVGPMRELRMDLMMHLSTVLGTNSVVSYESSWTQPDHPLTSMTSVASMIVHPQPATRRGPSSPLPERAQNSAPEIPATSSLEITLDLYEPATPVPPEPVTPVPTEPAATMGSKFWPRSGSPGILHHFVGSIWAFSPDYAEARLEKKKLLTRLDRDTGCFRIYGRHPPPATQHPLSRRARRRPRHDVVCG
jgi:hypothetical protein